ncbi:DMT family transporter [Desulfoplanes formicivorans]|uniref:Permease n=1 Tax=Desulfoplanes formicivorans TaxID=1592317 RepID=A0A194AFC5_9BACT|nr:DMT family transporter [Desulfoplanes formicivorans]GAU08772.1 permease [Desulfoplanes formicivorans]
MSGFAFSSSRVVLGYGFALAATVIWSGNFIVARGLADAFPPVSIAFFRWLIASVVLLPFGLPALIRQRAEVWANMPHLVGSAFLGITLFNTLIYIAGQHTTAMNLSLIAVFSPVFIIILARIWMHDPITPQRLLGVFLAVLGVVILTTSGHLRVLARLTFNPGDVLMLAATAVFAVYSILLRRKPRDIEPTVYLTATFLLGLVMLVPWAAWEWMHHPLAMPGPAVLGSLCFVGIGPALVAYVCWTKAVAAVGPVKAGIVYYALPLFSGIEAWMILGESMTWIHVLAGGTIIAGIVTATVERAQK